MIHIAIFCLWCSPKIWYLLYLFLILYSYRDYQFMKPEETWFMVIFVTLCSVICFLEIKRYQTLIVLKGVTYVVFVFCCTAVSMYLYCTQSQFLCDFQCDYFATGANIVCFDSGTRDMICMLLALIIYFFNISIKHYTLHIDIQFQTYITPLHIDIQFQTYKLHLAYPSFYLIIFFS